MQGAFDTVQAIRSLGKSTGTMKRKPANHGERSVKFIKGRGYSTIVKVEHEQAHVMAKKDLLGCDYLAISTQGGLGLEGGKRGSICLIQVCSHASRTERLKKMSGIAGLRDWLIAGGDVAILSFRKETSPRGAIKWEPTWRSILLSDLEAASGP